MSWLEKAIEISVLKFFEWLTNRFKRKRKVSEIMVDSVDVIDLSKKIVENFYLCVDFCYLANAFNGRRKSKDHKFKYRKLVSGYHREHEFRNFDLNTYRKLPVDVQYSLLLEKLVEEKSVILSVWKMEEGWLRSAFIYLEFNMVGFYLVDNDDEKHELWFLVIGSKTVKEEDFRTPHHNYIIKIALAELKLMIDLQRK